VPAWRVDAVDAAVLRELWLRWLATLLRLVVLLRLATLVIEGAGDGARRLAFLLGTMRQPSSTAASPCPWSLLCDFLVVSISVLSVLSKGAALVARCALRD